MAEWGSRRSNWKGSSVFVGSAVSFCRLSAWWDLKKGWWENLADAVAVGSAEDWVRGQRWGV